MENSSKVEKAIGVMKIRKSPIVLLAALLVVSAATSAADARQGRYGYHRYADPGYPRDGFYGWRGLRLFGFGYGERCDELLRKAIRIDTPDPVIGTLTTHRPLRGSLRRHLDLAIAEGRCRRRGNIV
jgi:hypothetical protein